MFLFQALSRFHEFFYDFNQHAGDNTILTLLRRKRKKRHHSLGSHHHNINILFVSGNICVSFEDLRDRSTAFSALLNVSSLVPLCNVQAAWWVIQYTSVFYQPTTIKCFSQFSKFFVQNRKFLSNFTIIFVWSGSKKNSADSFLSTQATHVTRLRRQVVFR